MITVIINGADFNYPEVGDTEWGDAATRAFQSLAATTLQKRFDSNPQAEFTLEQVIDFGGTAGIKALFFSSRNTDEAQSGVFRLCNGELIAWRNEDNDGDNTITFDSDGDLIVNGVKVTLHGQIVNDDIAAAAGIEESKLALDHSTQSLYDNIEDHKSDTANPHSTSISNLSDVDLVGIPYSNQAVMYDGNNAKWINKDIEVSDLADTIVQNETIGDILVYDGARWGNQQNSVELLSDASIGSKNNGDVLEYDSGTSTWINSDKLTTVSSNLTNHTSNTNNPHSTSVSNLTDTTITSALNGDVLSYDGSKWINSPSTSSSLSGLSDTDITTPANGDTLVYNSVSTKWENSDELATTSSTVSTHVADTNNPHSTSVSNLTDTTITTPSDQDTVVYDNVSSKWVNQANTLDNLKNTTITTPSSGDTLSYNGSVWVNKEDSLTNLTDTTITTPSDQDTIVYDNNSSKWINQANTINNISNVSIDSNTLAVGDALVFDDQDSLWKNDASFTNHIGNTSNPHLTTVAKLTDTTITTPANGDVLLYDYANSQWINSQIVVNEIANISTASTAVTLTALDKRHQIFSTATDGFDITLPSTGIKAGEKFVFEWTKDFNSTLTTPFVFKASGGNNIVKNYNNSFSYILTALVDNPTLETDWLFDYKLIRNCFYSGSSSSGSLSLNTTAVTNYTQTFVTIPPGYWNFLLQMVFRMYNIDWNNGMAIAFVDSNNNLLVAEDGSKTQWSFGYNSKVMLGTDSTQALYCKALYCQIKSKTSIKGKWNCKASQAETGVYFIYRMGASLQAPYTL